MSAADDAKITEDTIAFLKDTWWICSVCIAGAGCKSPMPLLEGRNKCLCMQQSVSSEEEICGPMGCMSHANKFLCCVSHGQFPPTDIKLAFCNIFCLGEPPQQMADRDALDMSVLSEAFWCQYCFCSGSGVTGRVADPLVIGQSKCLCCFSKQFTTDFCGPRGCVSVNQKCCCLGQYQALPPNITPGIGCCNMMFVGDNRSDQARAPAQQTLN